MIGTGNFHLLARSLDIDILDSVDSTFKSPDVELKSLLFKRQQQSVLSFNIVKFGIQYLWPIMLMREFCTFRLSQEAVLTFSLVETSKSTSKTIDADLEFPYIF